MSKNYEKEIAKRYGEKLNKVSKGYLKERKIKKHLKSELKWFY